MLRTLLARQERDCEAERKRVAWEVHEELGQVLMALRLNLEAAKAEQPADPTVRERLGSAKELLDRSIRVVRDLSVSLRPPVLDLDIVASLEWLADDFMRRTDIPCLLDIDRAAASMNEECRTVAFRIAQDALENIARHANASTAEISLRRITCCYFLRVRDDGKGIDLDTARGNSLGLLRMRERARMLDGDVRIFSAPGKGTIVDVILPDFTAIDAGSSFAVDFPPSDAL